MAETNAKPRYDLELSAQFAITLGMQEPSLRTSRIIIASAFFGAIAVGTAGFLIGRATSPPVATPVASEPKAPVVVPSPPPERPRVLGRADIIALADRAADATSSGLPVPLDILGLTGRRFDLVLPFGCKGSAPADSTAPLRWRYDAAAEVLRVHISPMIWQPADWEIDDVDGADQIAEGFWVSRPWSSSGTCSGHGEQAPAADSDGATPTRETLAVAQWGPAEPAGGKPRSPRSFETVKRVPAGQLDTTNGFRIRLSGRIDKLPGGQPIRCIQSGGGSEQRPKCLIAVAFDELAIEDSGGAESLATWSLRQRPGENDER
jgi:hypothetical protein